MHGAGSVGLATAVIAGLVSFLSPCVLPLVPGYLSTVAGVAPSELGSAGARRVVVPSLLFVLSFSAIFILLGLGATAIGATLKTHRDLLSKVSAVVIIALGALFVLSQFVARLNREWRVHGLMARAGTGGPLVAGAAFAIAWTPCLGPTLGAILTLGVYDRSEAHAALLLGFYSAGLAVPFVATALFFGYMTSAFGWIKRHYRTVVVAGGVVLMGIGVLILTGEFTRLNVEAQTLLHRLGLDSLDLSNRY